MTMRITKVQVTEHAAKRLAQRGIASGDLDLILRFGRRIHRTGATFYFFGKRQIPPGLERKLERLVGTTLLVADGHLITAYRNKHALAEIKKKLKRRRSPISELIPATILPFPNRRQNRLFRTPQSEIRIFEGGHS